MDRNFTNIPTRFQKKIDGLTFKMQLPKDVFEQQDLFQLLMHYLKKGNRSVWTEIRDIILSNSTVQDSGNNELNPKDLGFKDLQTLTDMYMNELIMPFFELTFKTEDEPTMKDTEEQPTN